MRKAGWTTEDQDIIAHAIRRSDTSFMLLVAMHNDDQTDMHIMQSRVEGRAVDRAQEAEWAAQDAADMADWRAMNGIC